MRKITLAAVAAGFLCSTMAIAAPIPSSVGGVGKGDAGDIVQVRKRKKSKRMRTKSQSGAMGGGMQGGSQGGAR